MGVGELETHDEAVAVGTLLPGAHDFHRNVAAEEGAVVAVEELAGVERRCDVVGYGTCGEGPVVVVVVGVQGRGRIRSHFSRLRPASAIAEANAIVRAREEERAHVLRRAATEWGARSQHRTV